MKKPRISRKKHDRISDLPEPILHHIKDAAKTWNSTWRSFPVVSLEFNQYRFRQSPRCRNLKAAEARREFCNHVNNCISSLSARQASSTPPDKAFVLEKLQVTVNFLSSSRRLNRNLDEWINYASKNNVKDLIVAYHASIPHSKKKGWRYTVPDALFNASSSVETLDLFGCEFGSYSAITTNGVDGIRFPRLRKLTLTHVCIDQETLESIVSNSPLLEEINLHCCQGFKVARLIAPKLRKADLFLSREWLGSIGINAPNLVSLTFGGGLGDFEESPLGAFGESLEASSEFKMLKELKLHDTCTTNGFLEVITDRFPELEELELERCRLLENEETGLDFLTHKKINFSR